MRLLLLASALLVTVAFAPQAAAEAMYCRDAVSGLPWGHPVNPQGLGERACKPVDGLINSSLCLVPPDIEAPCYRAAKQALERLDELT